MEDPSISRTLKLAAGADVLFAGVGGRVDRIDLYGQGYLDDREWQELAAAGMVGDIYHRFFDRDGRGVEHEVSGQRHRAQSRATGENPLTCRSRRRCHQARGAARHPAAAGWRPSSSPTSRAHDSCSPIHDGHP